MYDVYSHSFQFSYFQEMITAKTAAPRGSETWIPIMQCSTYILQFRSTILFYNSVLSINLLKN